MRASARTRWFLCGVLCFWVALGPVVLACSVPVFRYALERWPVDAYRVAVFHRGGLSKGHQAVVDWLKKVSKREYGWDTLDVATVDLAGKPDTDLLELWRAQKGAELPWMVVRYPVSSRYPPPPQVVWAGRLSAPAARRLVDSPVRRAIAKRLLSGDSGVWLLLESGDKKQDDAAARLLQAEAKKMEKALRLPPQFDPAVGEPGGPPAAKQPGVTVEVIGDDGFGPVGPPLKVAFSILRMSRTDPAEQLFVAMLLHAEEGLAELTEPMAFPFYGRARAFFAHVGKGINAENIAETCAFLAGPCACTIKAMAPGTDMLTATDWDASIEERMVREPELPPLVGVAVFAPDGGTAPEGKSASAPTPTKTKASTAHQFARSPLGSGSSGSPLARNTAIAVGAGLAMLAVAALALKRRL